MGKTYWWKYDSSLGDGWYFFCYNENGRFDYYIQEVDASTLRRTSKDVLGDAKFAWGKHEGGLGYDLKPLKAKTLEEAKTEFEEIYLQMLKDRVVALNKEKEQAIDEECSFFLYLKKKGHPIALKELG